MLRRLDMLSEIPLSRLEEAGIILRDELAGNQALAEAVEGLVDTKLEEIMYPDRSDA